MGKKPAAEEYSMTPFDFIQAARVPPAMATGRFGPWEIVRQRCPGDAASKMLWAGLHVFDEVTLLRRATLATLHLGGEVVMDDGAVELRRHLPIWLAARGRVLVSGLGLGCVVRGLLASPLVDLVDVIEIDRHILRAVGPEFEGNPRVRLHHGDALSFEWPAEARWDVAWHDIWCDGSGLQVLHAQLLARYQGRAARQGAWMLPRFVKRRVGGLIG